MEQTFVKKIIIKKVRHLKNVEIPLSDEEPKHLILTGKNGSGKTSLLDALEEHFSYVSSFNDVDENTNISVVDNLEIAEMFENIDWNEELNDKNGAIGIYDYDSLRYKVNNGKFIIAYYNADRKIAIDFSGSVNKVPLQDVYTIKENPGKKIIDYMVGLKATAAFAKQSDGNERAKEIDEWFTRFEEILKDIYNDSELKLSFDIETFEFSILTNGHEAFNFNQMSSGYSAIFSIINDLIMRSEKPGRNVEGIVMIDEIETHLHLELQRIILPVLTKLFPKIQFIVATHSPFILSSIKNAVIYDLENGMLVEDGLCEYPYEAIVESYYNADRLSIELSDKMNKYRELCSKSDLTSEDLMQIYILEKTLDEIPDFLSPDIAAEYSRIKLEFKNRRSKNG